MARITVEDCLEQITNRFELVMAASKRARELEMEPIEPLVARDNDKPTVIALREISAKKIDLTILEDYESVQLESSSHPEVGDAGEAV